MLFKNAFTRKNKEKGKLSNTQEGVDGQQKRDTEYSPFTVEKVSERYEANTKVRKIFWFLRELWQTALFNRIRKSTVKECSELKSKF